MIAGIDFGASTIDIVLLRGRKVLKSFSTDSSSLYRGTMMLKKIGLVGLVEFNWLVGFIIWLIADGLGYREVGKMRSWEVGKLQKGTINGSLDRLKAKLVRFHFH